MCKSARGGKGGRGFKEEGPAGEGYILGQKEELEKEGEVVGRGSCVHKGRVPI